MYKVELWGASGGYLDNRGGRGAYTSGFMSLFNPKTLYLYLGESGAWSGPATYNGGGRGTINVTDRSYSVSGGSGGGASDLRLMGGQWDDFESLKSRVMVSAGGAGSAYYKSCGGFIQGGAGGGLIGSNGVICSFDESDWFDKSYGAKQDYYGIGASSHGVNGKFGIGGYCNDPFHGSGGSGGYYGGGGGGKVDSRVGSGSGGSSYISGHENCKAISQDYTEANLKHLTTSVHFSGFRFYSTTLLSSLVKIPSFSSPDQYESNGHNGYGLARITVIETMNAVSNCIYFSIKYSYLLLFINIEFSEG
ncbi:loricrin, putative [Trichomonas vaginalis G3]|uniref:receptor protein-tyrosine kinase n=1 Tax=Trichomonas vaginalis (strain ATCC PRA-98 / G3) TaxID=412133 RepID=A2EFW1_TRIV3|nr:glycine-rich protein family [Trichomonas vaginalis G3]EAY08417.1 loricrin, putative [Trichomonas vaginalis G3]KAI5518151.1 glycine-rich protein family [Trichomonas vaginalis G3]|eukprot:XP_001320640.1 loricrin [Trichomonas vaginalis G3]